MKDIDNKMLVKLPIENILLEQGLITHDQLEIALKTYKQDGGVGGDHKLSTILVELGFVTEKTIQDILSQQTGIESFDIKKTQIDQTVIKLLPKQFAMQYKAVLLNKKDNIYDLAMPDIHNILVIDQVKRYVPSDSQVRVIYASESQILEIIDNYYQYEMSIEGILKEIETGAIDKGTEGSTEGNNAQVAYPTVRFVDAIIYEAIKDGASDIHFEPEELFVRIRYRIDGSLVQTLSFHKEYWPAISVRIKIIAGMNIAESRLPQDGRITHDILGREVDLRVSTHPTINGENIVMRILDKKKSLLSMEQLGFNDNILKTFKKLLMRPDGIIMMTGPTGSGKTTTLYAMLNYINVVHRNIMTLEDPVEYIIPRLRQTYVKEDIGLTFAEGVRAILRQDPDIVFIGEIRDGDTAQMALRTAMTGHQVFTTLHTIDSLGIFARLFDLGIAPASLSGHLICSIAQRLVRKLCNNCKQPYEITDEERKILKIDDNQPITLYKKTGCDKCEKRGYSGRIAVAEILEVNTVIDELIAKSATRNEIYEVAVKQMGFKTLAEDAISRIIEGTTDLESVIEAVNLVQRM